MAKKKEQEQEVELVKARVLLPIARLHGACLQHGMIATFPRPEYEAFLANGHVEPYQATSLKDAVLAIKAAGGEIVCDDDNAALIKIFAELEAADKPEEPEAPPADKPEGESEQPEGEAEVKPADK